jgi:hypothetical protein
VIIIADKYNDNDNDHYNDTDSTDHYNNDHYYGSLPDGLLLRKR